MNLLLDTHVLIWWLAKSPRLGKQTVKLLLTGTARPVVSAVSIWEIAIKSSIGRLDMPDPMESWTPRLTKEWGVTALPISFEHAVAVKNLPPHHADPFDRMLIAQSLCENLALVTVDPAFASYGVRMVDAGI